MPSPRLAGATVVTNETRASLTYGDLTTSGPEVTVMVKDSGWALVFISAQMLNSTAGDGATASYAVSGTTTVAASDDWGITQLDEKERRFGSTHLHTGLTPGFNTFTMKYRARVGGTANFGRREIVVLTA